MSGSAKNIFEVQVAGLPLKLRSSHDAQTVQELVQLIDQKISEAKKANSTVSFQNALVLAALNVAEELLLLKRTMVSELDQVEARAQAILEKIEDVTAVNN